MVNDSPPKTPARSINLTPAKAIGQSFVRCPPPPKYIVSPPSPPTSSDTSPTLRSPPISPPSYPKMATIATQTYATGGVDPSDCNTSISGADSELSDALSIVPASEASKTPHLGAGLDLYEKCSLGGSPMGATATGKECRAMCCVHNKSRLVDALVELEPGQLLFKAYRCRHDSRCRVSKHDKFDPNLCCIHKKIRAPAFLEEVEPGIMRCKPETPCREPRCLGISEVDNRSPLPSSRRSSRPPTPGLSDCGGCLEWGCTLAPPPATFTRALWGTTSMFPPMLPPASEDARNLLYHEGLRLIGLAMGAGLPVGGAKGGTPRDRTPTSGRSSAAPNSGRSLYRGLPPGILESPAAAIPTDIFIPIPERSKVVEAPAPLPTPTPGTPASLSLPLPLPADAAPACARCVLHDKVRSLAFLEKLSDGSGYRCVDNAQCKLARAAMKALGTAPSATLVGVVPPPLP